MIVSVERRLSGSGLEVRGRGCTRIGRGTDRVLDGWVLSGTGGADIGRGRSGEAGRSVRTGGADGAGESSGCVEELAPDEVMAITVVVGGGETKRTGGLGDLVAFGLSLASPG